MMIIIIFTSAPGRLKRVRLSMRSYVGAWLSDRLLPAGRTGRARAVRSDWRPHVRQRGRRYPGKLPLDGVPVPVGHRTDTGRAVRDQVGTERRAAAAALQLATTSHHTGSSVT